MNRNTAITAENNVLNELARIGRELETINLLIFHFKQRPNVVKKLAPIRARLLNEQQRLQAMRALLAQEI